MLKLNPGGPRLSKEGKERFDTTFTSNRGKNGKGKGSGNAYYSKMKGTELKGDADQEPLVGEVPTAPRPHGTEGAPFTVVNQNSNQIFPYDKERTYRKC